MSTHNIRGLCRNKQNYLLTSLSYSICNRSPIFSAFISSTISGHSKRILPCRPVIGEPHYKPVSCKLVIIIRLHQICTLSVLLTGIVHCHSEALQDFTRV